MFFVSALSQTLHMCMELWYVCVHINLMAVLYVCGYSRVDWVGHWTALPMTS